MIEASNLDKVRDDAGIGAYCLMGVAGVMGNLQGSFGSTAGSEEDGATK